MPDNSEYRGAVVRFECPEAVFDGDGYWVERTKRVKARAIERIADSIPLEEARRILAQHYVAWNLKDPLTGEALAQPWGNPQAFGELDAVEQLPWLARKMRELGN